MPPKKRMRRKKSKITGEPPAAGPSNAPVGPSTQSKGKGRAKSADDPPTAGPSSTPKKESTRGIDPAYVSTDDWLQEKIKRSPLYKQTSPERDRELQQKLSVSVLKRKHSQITVSSTASREEIADYISKQHDLVESADTAINTAIWALKEVLDEGKASTEDFKKSVKDLEEALVGVKRERLALRTQKDEVENGTYWGLGNHNISRAYSLAVASCFKGFGDTNAPWMERGHDQTAFREKLLRLYKSKSSTHANLSWCPVARRYCTSTSVIAAHIVPHHIGYDHAGLIFGQPGKGHDILFDEQNGIIMSREVEKAFDAAQLVIVPSDQTCKGKHWMVRLLDPSINDHIVAGNLTFKDLDGQSLEFKSDFRPARRYLFFHWMISLLRLQRMQKGDWASQFIKENNVWVTPGKWYHRSTLRTLAVGICNNPNADELFRDAAHSAGPRVPTRDLEVVADRIYLQHSGASLSDPDMSTGADTMAVEVTSSRSPSYVTPSPGPSQTLPLRPSLKHKQGMTSLKEEFDDK